MAKPAPLPTADGVAVGKGDGVDGVNHGLPLPTAILCQLPGSRQSQAVGKSCFADCRKFQLAKGPLCRVSKKNSWQRKLQSAKSQFPVVNTSGPQRNGFNILHSCNITLLRKCIRLPHVRMIFLIFFKQDTCYKCAEAECRISSKNPDGVIGVSYYFTLTDKFLGL